MMSNALLKVFFLSLVLGSPIASGAADTVIHPQPKQPIFLQTNRYPAFKAKLSKPPQSNSKEQIADEKTLLEIQTIRTNDQCTRATSEVMVSVKSFFGAPYGTLSDKDVQKLQTIFEQVRNDADYFIQLLKKDFPRRRPFLYIAGINPCVPKEITGAYPSGHATLAKLYALILRDLYPERSEEFSKRAQIIAEDRVLSGMHHPSDIKAGGELGRLPYEDLKRSEQFKTEMSKLR